jgi:hypothetical protein
MVGYWWPHVTRRAHQRERHKALRKWATPIPLRNAHLEPVQRAAHGLGDYRWKRPRPLCHGPEIPCHPTAFLKGLDPHASHALKRTAHGLTTLYAGGD